MSFGVFFGRVLPPGLVAPRRGDRSAGFDRAPLIREGQKLWAFLREIFLRCPAGGSSFLAKDLGWWEPRKPPRPWLLVLPGVPSPEEEKEPPRKSFWVMLVAEDEVGDEFLPSLILETPVEFLPNVFKSAYLLIKRNTCSTSLSQSQSGIDVGIKVIISQQTIKQQEWIKMIKQQRC